VGFSVIDLPMLGHGIGLRPVHYPEVVSGGADVDWFEVITENFLVRGGNPRRVLRAVRDRWPVVLHGVSMSLGGPDELDLGHLDAVAALAEEIEPAWISDHLCWSGLRRHRAHDLWPLPFTEEAVRHTADRIARVQDRLRRRILVENVSTYLRFAGSEMTEWEFVSAVLQRADCGLLLDVNNLYVNARNHGFDPLRYLEGLPLDRVAQLHLAGHDDHGTHLLDTHDHPVSAPVWELHRAAVRLCRRPLSTLVEWDDHLPPLQRVVAESQRARAVEAGALAELA
jgi:uncharacterized protein (UPF0276 family)